MIGIITQLTYGEIEASTSFVHQRSRRTFTMARRDFLARHGIVRSAIGKDLLNFANTRVETLVYTCGA